jgi:hypothetical protein
VRSLGMTTTYSQNIDGAPPWGVLSVEPGAPITQAEDVYSGPRAPLGGPDSVCCPNMHWDMHG